MAIAAMALVGLLVSLYLWFFKLGLIGELQCGTGACERVQLSQWGDFLGLPVPVYGVGGYLALLVVSLVGLQPQFESSRRVTQALAGLATGGLGFTVYLKYIELVVIGAVCRWCVVSAVLITLIFMASLLALRHERAVDAQPSVSS